MTKISVCVKNIYFYALQMLALNSEKIPSFSVHYDVVYTFTVQSFSPPSILASYLWLFYMDVE